jgi:cell division protein FtsZ
VITTAGHVNVDFADVRTVMTFTGRAVMGMGVARGPNRAQEAAQKAINSPLLEDGSVTGARGVLLNITGGPNMTLHEVNEAAAIIQDAADPQANIIVGQVINPDAKEDLTVTVVATGFERDEPQARPSAAERAATPRPAEPALAGVREAIGEEQAKRMEKPAFLRRFTNKRETQEKLGLATDDPWDVPTFLRKQGG